MRHFLHLTRCSSNLKSAFWLLIKRNQSSELSPVWRAIKSAEIEVPFSNGKVMRISTGKLARFADGSAVVQLGDTCVMVTAVGRTLTNTNITFLPLVVDYRQKAAAAGRIPTNFLRRELGPTETEILTSRMIDRSVRPLFRSGEVCDTQIMCNLLSVDGTHDPDIAAINGASAALALSDIPWDGPIGAVRVGLVDNELVINPTRKEQQSSKLNLVIAAGDRNRVIMIDSSSENILQPDFMRAIKFGVKEAQKVIAEIRKIQKSAGKPKRVIEQKAVSAEGSVPAIQNKGEDLLPAAPPSVTLEEITAKCSELASESLRRIFTDPSHDKISRDVAVSEIRASTTATLRQLFPSFESSRIGELFSNFSKDVFRNLIFDTNHRCDGRGLDDVRYIRCQTGVYNPLHGSALFERGQTQVLCTVTFDSLDSAWKADPASVIISGLKAKNFMVHYEFPPYATNETGRMSAYGRREMGHGALAEKALRAIIPNNFPFTIRLTSEVLESNGSSSMATVCGGSLALMDAGVPIFGHAAGVAVGLMTKYEPGKEEILDYRILTDILGIEDYLGDMDFKMAGTKNGITALQVDVKIPGLPLKICMEAIQKATDGRIKILDIMSQCLKEPRAERKENAPVTEKLDIPPQKRAKFVGFGGYNLKKITAETGVQITQIEDCSYNLFAPNQTALDEAKLIIKDCLEDEREPELQFGAVYTAKIVEIKDTGVMITLHPGQAPFLLPNSQLDMRKVSHPSALNLGVGQEISVKYFGRDPATGRHRASRKVLMSVPSTTVKSLHE